ncbi:MAG: hypothetical protein JNM91_13625, partial [Flavobacteriales bacterium]|nr:hypothetical protein [Flavobacteriales bacterium]
TWGDWDVWLIRLDASGTLLWERAYGGSGSDSGMSIVETADGGFTLLGTTWSSDGQITSSQGGQDLWLVHVDSNGVLEWQRTYGGTSTDYGRSVAIAVGGGYYIAGMTYSTDGDVSGNHGGQDIWLARVNEVGEIQWSRAYGSTGEEEAREVIALADGGAVFAGKTSANNGDVVGAHGVDDGWVVRVDATGAIVWQRPLGGTYSEIIEAISIGLNGEILCAGNAGSHNGDVVGHHGNGIELDAWAVALDPSTGVLLWQRCLGGSDNDYGADIDVRSDGAFVVLGTLDSEDGDVTCGHGAFDFWLVGLSPFTGLSDVAVSSSEQRLTAWPVPATERIQLRVQGRSGAQQVLDICDALGHTVHSTVLSPAMNGVVEWDLRDLGGDPVPAGVFYARLQGQVRGSVRLVVVR